MVVCSDSPIAASIVETTSDAATVAAAQRASGHIYLAFESTVPPNLCFFTTPCGLKIELTDT
jgi:hypothetical protein